MKQKFNLLFSAATEFAAGGGAAPTATAPATEPEAPETPAEPEAPAAPAAPETKSPTKEPTLLQVAFAAAKGKAHLVSENQTLLQRAYTAETALATLQAAHTDLTAKFTALSDERAQIAAALTQSQQEVVAVEVAAAAQVASIGFPEAKLPESLKAGESRQELEAQLAAATDNKTRWELAKKLNEMP